MAEAPGVIVLSGLSGAGKSAALNTLEDVGYYCVDNLPPPLIKTFLDLCRRAPGIDRVALVVDVRTLSFLDQFAGTYRRLLRGRNDMRLVFLDAENEILQQRFSETRRPHPLAGDGNLLEGIVRERERLAPIRELADDVVDTSNFSPHELRDFLVAKLGERSELGPNIAVTSFGYRHGLPANADLVFDLRFLPNPNYVPELKPLTGMDKSVREFVESQRETQRFLAHLEELLGFLIPQYQREGRAYLTLAFGCTGGQHRSVAIASHIAHHLEQRGLRVALSHRELPR